MRGMICLFLMFFFVQEALAETPVERGRYLVEVIAACGNCHSRDFPGSPDQSMHLAGGFPIEQPGMHANPPNITQDLETGIGSWTDEQIEVAIREGVRPDGRVLGPPMPFELYRSISDEDIAAIIAYLRTVPPVKNQAEPSSYDFPLPPAWGPPVGKVAGPDPDNLLEYGAYLAGPLGHCIECHSTPGANGVPDIVNALGAGGFPIYGPWGVSVSSNITPTGLSNWSDQEIKTVITTGKRPNGTTLRPPMGVSYYAGLTEHDLDAIVAYLRSLPPK